MVFASRAKLALLFVCLLVAVTGCGGGGGGGGGNDGKNAGNSFIVTLNQSSVAWSYLQGMPAGSRPISARVQGTYSGEVFVKAVVENAGSVNAVNPAIPMQISATEVTAVLNTAPNLPVGTYSGRVLFFACADAACATPIGGTPLALPFTVAVLAGISAVPTAVEANAVSGTPFVVDLVVQPGASDTDFVVSNVPDYARITNQSPTSFRLTLLSVPTGTYNSALRLQGSAGSSVIVPVNYRVSSPPGGQHSILVNGGLTLAANEGRASAVQLLQVTQPSWKPGLQAPLVAYGSGSGWLKLTPVPGGYEVIADATQLAAGTYSAAITLRPNDVGVYTDFAQGSALVPVAFTVGAGLIAPPDVIKDVHAESTAADLTGSVSVNLVGGGTTVFKAASNFSAVQVAPTGTTGSPLTFQIDPTWLATADAYYEHTARITITPEAGTVYTPVAFNVRVTRKLPEITSIGASVQLTNRPGTAVIRGRGFDAIASPLARLQVAGGSASSVQRISDTEMLVRLNALSAGSHDLSLSNALGMPTRTASVTGVDPQSHAYSTVTTNKWIDVLVPLHQSGKLAAVSQSSGTLMLFQPGTSDWSMESSPIVDVNNVAVRADRFAVATTKDGHIHLLDPFDLHSVSSFKVADCIFAPSQSPAGIPMTNDARVWIAVPPDCSHQSSQWNQLRFLAQFQTTLAPAELGSIHPSFLGGPNAIVSHDGERMHLRQTTGMSPAPPMLYLDAVDNVMHESPGDVMRWGGDAVATNEDGSKIILNRNTVVNDQFAIVGRIEVPNYTVPTVSPFPAAAIFSPDGSKAYVLTYRNSDVGSPAVPPLTPRVYVFDTSTDVGDHPYPVLGYFVLPDYPSCLSDVLVCDVFPPTAISLDGNTLFFAGSSRFIVAPIPATLTPVP